MTSTTARPPRLHAENPMTRTPSWARPSFILVRYTFIGYLQCVAVIYACILCVALAADFTVSLRGVVNAGPQDDILGQTLWIAYYISLRIPDMTGNFIGVVAFVGVLWWEIMQSKSGQRVAAWNGGQSPARSLFAVALLGLLVGGVQYACDAWLRPAAVEAQMQIGLGKLGQRYDVRLSDKPVWATVGDDILLARIEYGTPTVLHDLFLFRLDAEGRLEGVAQADAARLTDRPNYWRVENASWAEVVEESFAFGASDGKGDFLDTEPPAISERADSELLMIDLDPELFMFRSVQAEYLSRERMRGAVERGEPRYLQDDYKTRLHYHVSHAFYPALMAALAATLAIFVIGKQTPILTYVLIALSGYVGHVLMKVSATLGELGYLPPIFAAWVGAMAIALLVALLQFRVALRTFGA